MCGAGRLGRLALLVLQLQWIQADHHQLVGVQHADTAEADDRNCFQHLMSDTNCQLEADPDNNNCMDCLFRNTILFKMSEFRCNPNALKAFCSSAQAANFRVGFIHGQDSEERQFQREIAKLSNEEMSYTPHLNKKDKIKALSQKMSQEEQAMERRFPLVVAAQQAEINKGLDEYETRFAQFEKDHPYFDRVEEKMDEKYDEGAEENFARAIGEHRDSRETPHMLHEEEKTLAGGSEVLKLKATFFKDWKKFLVGEKGTGNLPRLPGAPKKKKKHYFTAHTTYRYSGSAVGEGDDDIEPVRDETPGHIRGSGSKKYFKPTLPPPPSPQYNPPSAARDDDNPYGPGGGPGMENGESANQAAQNILEKNKYDDDRLR